MSVSFSVGDDGVAEVRLTNPRRRNALGFATLQAIVDALETARTVEARAIVLTADGPTFSAGADFADLTGTSADLGIDDAIGTAVDAIGQSHIPVIAAVHAPCFGAAVDIVLAADIVVAARSATFHIPATTLGLLYNPSAIVRLHRRLPSVTLRQLMLGVALDADAAVAGGVIASSVPDEDLASTIADIAAQVSSGIPEAVRATKALLVALDAGPIDLDEWQAWRRRLLDSDARRAVISKRQQSTP